MNSLTPPPGNTRSLCIGLLLLILATACVKDQQLADQDSDVPQIPRLCLIMLPLTIYSDDDRIDRFTANRVQEIKDGIVRYLNEELEAGCEEGDVACQAAPPLLFRETAGITPPPSSCGSATTNGVIPQGYNYNQCLLEWGNDILTQRPDFCFAGEGQNFTRYRPVATGLWIEAYKNEDFSVRPILVDLPRQAILEADTAGSFQGSLSRRRLRSTVQKLAEVAGSETTALLRTHPELGDPVQ